MQQVLDEEDVDSERDDHHCKVPRGENDPGKDTGQIPLPLGLIVDELAPRPNVLVERRLGPEKRPLGLVD